MVIPPARHQPIVGLALTVVVGTGAGLVLPCPPWIWAGVAALLLLVWFLSGHRHGALLLLSSLLLAAANGSVTAQRDGTRTRELRALAEARTPVILKGTIVTEPNGERLPHGGARLSFQFRATEAVDAGGRPVERLRPFLPFRIDVDFYGPESFLSPNPSSAIPEAGQGWMFGGRIRAREVSYRTEPILSLRTAVDEVHRRASAADAPVWRQRLWDMRREMARRLALGLADRPRDVAILRALLLGYRADVPAEVRDLFARSGTVHVFAISGLHILIIAKLLSLALRRTGVPWRIHTLILLPLLAAYTILSGGRPSAVRACVMASVHNAAGFLHRRPSPVSSVATAAIVILVASPGQLADLGFAFSFASVLGILLLSPSLKVLFAGFRRQSPQSEADDLVLRMERARERMEDETAEGPLSRLRATLRGWRRKLSLKTRDGLAVSVAAWSVAEPITARVFGQLVPVSVVSNVLVIPAISVTVSIAAVGFVVGAVHPLPEMLCNLAAALLLNGIVWFTGVCSSIPLGNFETKPWPVGLVAVWYGALLVTAFLLHIAAERRRRADIVEEDFDS